MRAASLGPHVAQAHGGEGRFDRVGRAQVAPAVSRAFVEGEESLLVFLQAFPSGGIFCGEGDADNMMAAIGTRNIRPAIVTVSLGTSGTIFACTAKPAASAFPFRAL